jgi:pimeloyl-ACP methyl ester carboxylesterase
LFPEEFLVILHAEIMGQGPPVALLHGLFGRGRNLLGVARGLAASHRVIMLDLRNHGQSPHAPDMAYATMAGDVMETLGALDALPASLLGHSMGGKTAMACALITPDAVRRLLVADIAPVAYRHGNAAIAEAMRALPLRAGMDRKAADAGLVAGVADEAVRGFLLQNFIPGVAPGWRIGLAEIAAAMGEIEGWPELAPGFAFEGPVLFVAGGQSDYVTPQGREAARARFPRAKFMILKQAGHWLHADQPAAFLEVASTFFAA